MAKLPWRFQGDVAHGETDPMVTVFMGEVETDGNGNDVIRQDASDPLQMRLSEFDNLLDLTDGKKLDGIRLKRKAAAKAKEDAVDKALAESRERAIAKASK